MTLSTGLINWFMESMNAASMNFHIWYRSELCGKLGFSGCGTIRTMMQVFYQRMIALP